MAWIITAYWSLGKHGVPILLNLMINTITSACFGMRAIASTLVVLT